MIDRALSPPGPRLPRRLQTLALAFAPPRFIEACHRRYGDVVAFRTVSNPRFVMVFEPELVKQVFGGSPERLRTGEARAKLVPLVGERSVLMLDGAEHVRRRRLLLPPLHGELMRAHVGDIQDATDRMVDSWPTGQPFALLPSTQALSLEVLMRVVFGREQEPGQEELAHGIRAVLGPSRPRRLRTLGSVSSRAHRRRVDELIYERISRRRAAPDLAKREDVLSLLLGARDEDGRAMTDHELRDDLVGLLFAGAETTPTALAWAFELLLRHPAVLARLEAELGNGEDYLNAVVKETLRLRPPVVYVGRVVRGPPYELGGHRIPPGTEIRASVATVHRRADQYPEPRAFHPDRFLGRDPPDTYSWLAFGGGVRRCLGASFVTFEMAVIIRRVLERTGLTPVGRRPEKAVLDGSIQVPARGVRVIKRPSNRAGPGARRAVISEPRPGIFVEWARLARWREWAQSKLPFMTAVTVLLVSPNTPTPRVVEIVATVMAGAAFGYGLNEASDRASDARAGKPNRAAGLAPWRWMLFLIVTAAGAFGLSVAWAPDAAAPSLVLLGLALAVAYSAPPLRLKERGAAALAGAAGAQWAVPALVVSAAEPRGWLRPVAWSFALLGLAIGTRWMAVHQFRDAVRDRRAGVRTYGSRRGDASSVLPAVFACELVLLGTCLALTWPSSLPAAIALILCALPVMLLGSRRRSLRARLAGYADAPLAGYYFFALPVAVAVGRLITPPASAAISALLLALALPHLLGRIRSWLGRPFPPQPRQA